MRARARALYGLALNDADWTPESVCGQLGWTRAELVEATDALAELGLAAHFPESASGWSVLSPAASMARLLETSRRNTDELLEAVTRAHSSLAQVLTEFQPIHFRQLSEGRVEVGVQPSQIAAILDEGSLSAGEEILSMHPGRPPVAERLAAGDDRNRDALARGVTMRTLHITASALMPHMRAHLRQLVGAGAEVRTAPTLPMKMIIVDRGVAVVPSPGADDTTVDDAAMVLRSPAVVSVLRQFFEYFWAASTDLILEEMIGAPGSGTRHREVVRLLASGLTDEAIARKLGLSDRTVRRIVAELMQQIGADSRFQAGVKMVRLGWLDEEPAAFTDPAEDVVGSTPQVR